MEISLENLHVDIATWSFTDCNWFLWPSLFRPGFRPRWGCCVRLDNCHVKRSPPPPLSRACSNLPQQVPSSDHISFLGSRARYGSIELDMSTELDRPSISEQPRGTILPFNHLIFSYRICRGKKYLYRHSRYTQVFGHTMNSFSSSFCSFLVPAFINAYFNVFVGLLLFTQKATSVSIIRRGIVVQIT